MCNCICVIHHVYLHIKIKFRAIFSTINTHLRHDLNSNELTVDNPQALPRRPTCFLSREESVTTATDSHQRNIFRRPAAAPLPPCQASGLPTSPSSPLERRRSPPVEATVSPPVWSWTRAPASGRRTGWGRCCRREGTTQQ